MTYQDPRYRDPEYRAKWAVANPERGAAYLEQKRKRYHEDPEAMRQRARRNYAANRERRLAYQTAYNTANKQAIADRLRERKFGLSVADFEAMRRDQGDACAICRLTGLLAVDHNHKTGEVRGLLCSNCNFLIGHGKDDPGILRAAAVYLEGRRDA